MTIRVLHGDCRDMLKTLTADSVHCVVTSPPYWGLRDYMIDGQIGLESSPQEYVRNLVSVFREVRRVLRRDGVCFLNLGDTYAGCGTIGRNDTTPEALARRAEKYQTGRGSGSSVGSHGTRAAVIGLKPKDLVGIPWRVALALQDDGWYLRSDIIWAKPNPMPESVTDRPSKSHEYVFLLAKSERYFWDKGAVSQCAPGRRPGNVEPHKHDDAVTVNLRSVWTIAHQPSAGLAHFAIMPQKLAETCIKAGTSEYGCCKECGTPRVRDAEYGFRAVCECGQDASAACTVLDPFAGAGTTLLVADRLGRNAIGIELNPEYCKMADTRVTDDRGPLLDMMLSPDEVPLT